MKKIMFMMMPLILTALIFGAGCDQDPSTTRDNDRPVATGDPEIDVPFQPGGLTLADLPWDDNDVIQYQVTANGTLNELPTPEYDGKPFVPAGKALWLSNAKSPTAPPTLRPSGSIIVEGDLIVRTGTILEVDNGTNASPRGRIYLSSGGRLIVNKSSELSYGSSSTIYDVGTSTYSALKSGGGNVVFNEGSSLNLKAAQDTAETTSGTSGFYILDVDPATLTANDRDVSLRQVYANSAPADVYIKQKTLSNDYIFTFDVTTNRNLYIDGEGSRYPITDTILDRGTVTVKKGLVYTGVRSKLEHQPLIVEGEFYPNQEIYPKTLTIRSGATYENTANLTRIDSALTVDGIGEFDELTFADETAEPSVTVNTSGKLTIRKNHVFYYTPTINGTLTLLTGGQVYNVNNPAINPSLNINGSLYLGEGSLALTNGQLDSTGGRIDLGYEGSTRYIILSGEAMLAVKNSLDLTNNGFLAAGSLVATNQDTYDAALSLENARLSGDFTVKSVGTIAAQIATNGRVAIINNGGSQSGVLDGVGSIDFTHNLGDQNGTPKSFILTGTSLSTGGSMSTLSLTDGQSIVFGKNAPARGVTLKGGYYQVESSGGGTRFALGYLEGSLGIGIGKTGTGNDDGSGNGTSLVLGPNSTIRFYSDSNDVEQIYLLTGSASALRESYDTSQNASFGTESSLFAVKGTMGASPTIEIATVLMVGSLGHATSAWTNHKYPLFTYLTGEASGTAATGSLSVNLGGSLTVDHNKVWTYGQHGWSVAQKDTFDSLTN